MKRNLLYIRYITVLSIVFSVFSCTDLLDQKPQGKWIEEDAKGGGYESAVFNLYGEARGFEVTSGNSVLAVQSFRSEDAEKGSNASDGSEHEKMYDEFQYNASNGLIEKYWSGHYGLIHQANLLISEIEANEPNPTEGTLINKAEACFFRAYAYFNLVRAFGEVPLIDFKVEDDAQANIPKSSVEDIYTLIDSDLTFAETNLPPYWESKYVGRLTWGAARALHARTYMMRNDWTRLYTASKEVVDSKLYNLDTPFNKIFREDGENSSESVFEIQCTSTQALPASSNIGSEFAVVQGVRGNGKWDLGWGWNTPTQLLADAFEPGDPRKDETLLYFYRSEAEAEQPAAKENAPWGEKPIAQSTVTSSYYNKKVYTNPSWREMYSLKGFWVNIRIIRYSDVLLMAAEAANETGKTGEALNYLEEVRMRARGNNLTILPKVTTTDQEALRQAIRHERRVELAMEFDRFYDLVRWGIATQVLHAAGKTNYQSKHALLPIPLVEIDKSNGVLVQNPNY